MRALVSGWCRVCAGGGDRGHTLPTAASPSRTSLTLLLGLGALGAGESDMAGSVGGDEGRLALRLLPTA